MRDPIVLVPQGFDCDTAWRECAEYVKECGGIQHKDGSINWRAAFGADPGCMSCPQCGVHLWSWGKQVRCPDCAFEFPTDWWPMYSSGVAAAKKKGTIYRHDERLLHPYYRYGFTHPVDDAWTERANIDWSRVIE